MKNFKTFLIVLILSIFISPYIIAQSVPQGMKYQAVARDLTGKVLSDENISIKITLLSNSTIGEEYYTEVHKMITNQMGLFSLVIGQGDILSGKFDKTPWSSQDIWMEIGIKTQGDFDFTSISKSKLLAVPYAFHATTASELVPSKSTFSKIGVPSNVWSLQGNLSTDPNVDKIGTTDHQDFVFITDNIERLRITATGKLITPAGVGLDLGGSLKVRGDSTTIDKDLYIGRNVYLNNDDNLDPRGETFNYGNFTVETMSSTMLTGTLDVDLATDLNDTLNVDGETDFNSNTRVNSTTTSTATNNGAFVVTGGTGIGENLNVGGDATFGGEVTFGGKVAITDLTQSTNSSSGALVVAGGAGVGMNLNVGGVTTLNNASNLNGQVTINAAASGGDGSYGAYPLRVQGSSQGLAIKLNAGTPNNSNNFITFFNSSGGAIGRIEGETYAEALSTPEYIVADVFNQALVVKAAADVLIAFIPMPGVGLGAVATVCVPCVAMAAVDVILAEANVIAYDYFATANLGVTYQSGSADYAEWLERFNPSEKISAGEIVGVNSGKISKYTANAQQFMVISTKPAILGNMPMEGKESLSEKVAFMGQIPVKVRGMVVSGDYILPSGKNDGIGMAISPDEITAKQYREIVGVAWSSSLVNSGVSLINMAIGLNSNDVANLAVKQEAQIAELENNYRVLNARIVAMENGTPYVEEKTKTSQAPVKSRYELVMESMPAELDDNVMEDAIALLKAEYINQGINIADHAGLNKLFTDAAFKEKVIKKAQVDYKKTYQDYLTLLKSKN